ncbi:MAG TPA: citramalate synthase [Polyangiaceae bacterium]|nr:citramalate synthase [Polyangiaceae bacterium]
MASLEIYDTTLRDGTQGFGVDLSLADKLALTERLDALGVCYVEGGWPGSNPKDRAYFAEVRRRGLARGKVSAFGSTRRSGVSAEEDLNLRALADSDADVTCIFGKSWDLHITEALRVSQPDNLRMIAESIEFLRRSTGRPVFYDAEHFFDGLRENEACALATVRAAFEAGAERIILCDTNGGSLPAQIVAGIQKVRAALPGAVLGIHVHNDGGLATANTLAAIQAGVVQVHGTINGVGERCGNADLTQVIANCELKLGLRCLPEGKLAGLTEISREVWERINRLGPDNQPFVGPAAFAHKGGVHVSAMQRNERTYEHVPPASVGNLRRVLISEMAGRSSLLAKLEEKYPELRDAKVAAAVLNDVQDLEHEGYSFEAADGSFDLLVRRHLGLARPAFRLDYYRVHGIGTAPHARETKAESSPVEATVKLDVGGQMRLCVAEGNGPVDALSHALRLALDGAFPALARMVLTDYKVRVVNSADGAGARVRVLIEHELDRRRFSTIGVHANIIEASWHALVDAIDYGVALAAEDAGKCSAPQRSALA